jgi:hypothetical protein
MYRIYRRKQSDYEIVCDIAAKLGVEREYTEGKSVADWIRTGFDHSRIQNLISWEELTAKQYYVIPTSPEWQKDLPD